MNFHIQAQKSKSTKALIKMGIPFSIFLLLSTFNFQLSTFSQTTSPLPAEHIQLWLRADSVEITDGKVSKWYDLSPNNYLVQQTNASARPVVMDSAINGHPALLFNGTSTSLTGGDILNLGTDSWTWFVVSKNCNNNYIFSKCISGTIAGRYGLKSNQLVYQGENNNAYNLNYSSIQDSFSFSTWINDRNTNKNYIYVNKELKASGNINGSFDMTTTRPVNFYIGFGSYAASSFFFNGQIAEVIAINKSNTHITNNIHNYLIEKYFPEYIDSLTEYEYGEQVSLESDILVQYSFCDTAITTAYNPDFTSYLWNTGETDSVIHVSQPGQYSVTVTNSLGYTSTDNINVYFTDVYQMYDSTICAGDTIFWDTELISDGYSFQWFKNGIITSTEAILPLYSTGNYYGIITDSRGCIFQTDTLHLAIDNYPISTSFEGNSAMPYATSDTSLCVGNTLGLATNIEETSSYIWSTGSTAPHITLTESGPYTLTSTNSRGCVAVNSIYINILGEAPEINYTVDNTCFKDYTSFFGNSHSEQGIESYLWIIDNTDSIADQSFNHSFASTGIHNIRTIVTSNNTCRADSSFSITIKELPNPNFTYTPVCTGIQMNFIGNSTIPDGTSVESYTWLINDSIIGTNENLTFGTDNECIVPITYALSISNGCQADTTINISVRDDYAEPRYVSPAYPSDGMFVYSDSITFLWNYDYDILYYNFITSESADFVSADTIVCSTNSLSLPTSIFADTTYWKVAAYNYCLIATESEPYFFHKTAGDISISSNTNLQLWLRADSVELTDGKVSQWYDLSSNKYVIQQSNANSRPTISDMAINDNPALQFNGANTFLSGGNILNLGTDSWTWIIVSNNRNNNYIFSKCISGPIAGRYGLKSNQLIYQGANNAANTLNYSSVPNTFITTTWTNDRYSNKNSIFINKELKATGTINGSFDMTTSSDVNFFVGYGGFSSTNYYFDGQIAEIIAFNLVDDYILKNAYNYIAEKYFPDSASSTTEYNFGMSVSLGLDIHVPYGFCDTAITTAYNPDFSSYLWSTGETDSIIHINHSGRYTVTVTNSLGYTSSDDIYVYFPEHFQLHDTTICAGDTIYWNLKMRQEEYSFQWFKDGVQLADASNQIEISEAGAYTCLITDTLGCSFQTDTLHLTIDNYPISTSFEGNSAMPYATSDTSLCVGNTLGLATNIEETSSYIWSTGSTAPHITLTESGPYTLTSTNSRGCVAVNSIYINILGEAPEINYTVDNTCFKDYTSFFGNSHSEQGIESYLWIIDNTDSIADQSFNHSFASTGIHNIRTIVTSNNTCRADSSFSITIKELPNPNFTYTPVCTGIQMNFIGNSTIPDGTSVESYTWLINDSIIGTNENLTFGTDNECIVPITYALSISNGCQADTTINISVRDDYAEPRYVSPAYPSDGMFVYSDSITFLWNYDYDILYYNFITSESADFVSADTIVCSTNSLSLPTSIFADTTYWKVAAYNYCLIATESEPYFFHKTAGDISISSNTNLQLWLRADSVELTDGKVSQWYDLSSNKYVIQQSNANSRPTISDMAINDNPALQFNGANTFLSGGNILNLGTDSWTWIIVSNNRNNNYIFSKCISGPIAGRYGLKSNQLIYQGANNAANTLNYSSVPNTFITTTWTNDRYSNKNSIFINKELKATGTINGSFDMTTSSDVNFFVGYGGFSSTNYYFDGQIAEIIAFNLVDDYILKNAYNYIAEKYFPDSASSTTEYNFGMSVSLGLDIHVPYGFCDTAITTAYNPDFISYQWSTGETDSIIHINHSGRYTVTVTNSLGYTSSDDIYVYFPEHFQLQDTTICAGDIIYWNLKLRQNDYTFQWYKDGETYADASNQIEISETGAYTCIITDSLGCNFQTDTMHLAIDIYPISAGFEISDTTLCYGNRLHIASGYEETASAIWDDGTTELEHYLTQPGTYTVTTTNTRGCTATNSINVNIQGRVPTPNFSIEGHCQNAEITTTNLSTSEIGEISLYRWYANDSLIGTTENISHSFDKYGTQSLKLYLETSDHCFNDTTIPIYIYPQPKPDFSPKHFCQNAPTEINARTTIAEGDIINHLWNLGDGSIAGESITNTFESYGIKTITLSAESEEGCIGTKDIEVNVLQAEMPATEISGVCLGYETTFINKTQFNNINPQTAWEWNFGDDTETSPNKNTAHTYDTTGTYNVSLTVSFANHCSTTTDTTITIHELPEATITANDGCVGTETTLDAEIISVDNIATYKWQIDSIFESSERRPTFVSDTTGTFAITLDVLTEFSCPAQATDSIIIHRKPDVAFTQSRDWGGSPLFVEFENTSEGATSYHWGFGNEGESSQVNPYYIFTEPGTYEVSLIGTNEFGCSSKYISSAITVVEPIVDIMLMDLKANEENGFAKISLIIVNLGTLPVEDLVLELKYNDHTFRESIDYIAQGEVRPYTFGTQMPVPQSNTIKSTICVEALVPDVEDHNDMNLANNSLCITDAENLSVGIPYPIPAREQITCDIYTKIPTDLDISIFNIFGKLVKHEQISQHKGYLKYDVNVMDLAGGMYFIRVNSKDESITHKFEIR